MISPQMLQAALAAHAQGGPPPPPPGGPSPQAPPGPPPTAAAAGGGGGDATQAVSFLRQAIQNLHSAGNAEPDPEDKAVIAKVVALILQMIAKDSKERDAALGTTPAHKAMRNAQGGPPA